MPGLPVELEPESEVVTELLNETTLNEVSPVTVDTIPDLEIDQTTRAGILEGLENYGDEEDDKEEPLSEVDPPDEDELEDDEPPDRLIDSLLGDERLDSDQESDDDDILEEGDTISAGTVIRVGTPELDIDQTDSNIDQSVNDEDKNTSDTEQTETKTAEQVDQTESDSQRGDEVDIKRDTSEEFHDAEDKLEGETNSHSKESKETQDEGDKDEQTNRIGKDTMNDSEIKDKEGHGDHEGTPVDPVESTETGSKDTSCDNDADKTESDSNSECRTTDIDHNSNIENQSGDADNTEGLKTAKEESCEQDGVELRSDKTVTGLRTSTAETV